MFLGWNTAGGAEMSDEAVGFMIGGIVFSIVVGCGLMFLVFFSSRSGYDEPGRLMRKDEQLIVGYPIQATKPCPLSAASTSGSEIMADDETRAGRQKSSTRLRKFGVTKDQWAAAVEDGRQLGEGRRSQISGPVFDWQRREDRRRPPRSDLISCRTWTATPHQISSALKA